MDAFFGEIRLMAFQFQPAGWLWCNGATLSVQANQALFAVIGHTYDPSSQTNPNSFCLPNLTSLVAVCAGDNPTDIFDPVVGKQGGAVSVSLSQNQIPPHTHTATGATIGIPSRVGTPAGNYLTTPAFTKPGIAGGEQAKTFIDTPPSGTNPVAMAAGTISPYAGLGQAHENRQPYLQLNYFICNDGAFPVRP